MSDTNLPQWRRRILWLSAVLLLLLGVRTWVCDLYLVVESSMWPALAGHGDRVLLNHLAQTPQRFEVWAYRTEDASGNVEARIKRVIGLEGEVIALRGGDVFTGREGAQLRRAMRTAEQAESMRVLLPGPAASHPTRWRVVHGTLERNAKAELVLHAPGGVFSAVLRGSVAADSVMDDFADTAGLAHPGRHVVADAQLDVVVYPQEEGRLELLHELSSGTLGIRVEQGQLFLSAGGAALSAVAATGLPLTLATRDGQFIIRSGPHVLYQAERDTLSGRSLSLWRVEGTAPTARLGAVQLSRDVHFFFGGALESMDGYNVPPASCFAAGDNQPVSSDSRHHGPVSHRDLLGRAERIVLPRARARALN